MDAITLSLAAYHIGLVGYLICKQAHRDDWWPLRLLDVFAPLHFLPLLLTLPLTALHGRPTDLILPALLIWWAVCRYLLPVLATKRHVLPAAEPDVRVLTFNILRLNPHVPSLVRFLQQVDADVIVLQEVVSPVARAYLSQTLADAYPYMAAARQDQMILSRHAIIAQETLTLDASEGEARAYALMRQQVLRVSVRVGAHVLAVYAVHLPTPIHPNIMRLYLNHHPIFSQTIPRFVLGYDERVRNAQLRGLMAVLGHERQPFLVVGDFNTSAYSPIYRELSQTMHDAFAQAGCGFGMTWPNSLYMPPLLRLDYIWHSADLHTLTADVLPFVYSGSDHLPLVASLRFKDGASQDGGQAAAPHDSL
jgi:vancomycin resistance protein VanJ